MDVHTKSQRSYNMSCINNSETKPELRIKVPLLAVGFSYQPRGIFGRPDFADKRRKFVVFVDGCFWHGCSKHCIYPKTNALFWKNKISNNVKRDRKVNLKLKKDGWKVIRIWEHSLKS